MDAFELARRKHAKSLERKQRFQAAQVVPIGKPEAPVERKAKGLDTAGYVSVTVKLPSGDFSFTLIKQGVLQNAIPSKLTRSAFINCVMKGLEPLLGGVKEI